MSAPRIRFLGTGTAFNDDGRGSSCLLVESEQLVCLVDAGPTVAVSLTRQRLHEIAIDSLFLTHLHGDHFAGWPFLLLRFQFVDRRSEPFHIYGPKGTRRCLEQLVRLCYGEIETMIEFDLHYHELEAPARVEVDRISIDVVAMHHHESSIGYRFAFPGPAPSRLGITGDTGWCDGIEQLSAGTDVLVTECTTVDPGQETHLCLEQIRRGRSRLSAKTVVLTHLSDEVAENLAIDPVNGVVAAHDGMSIVLRPLDEAAPH